MEEEIHALHSFLLKRREAATPFKMALVRLRIAPVQRIFLMGGWADGGDRWMDG